MGAGTSAENCRGRLVNKSESELNLKLPSVGEKLIALSCMRSTTTPNRIARIPVKRLTPSEGLRALSNRRARHTRNSRHRGNLPGKLPGNEAVRLVLDQGVENLGNPSVNPHGAIESEASRIQQRGAEYMLFMQGGKLSTGNDVGQQRIESIRLDHFRAVMHVRTVDGVFF